MAVFYSNLFANQTASLRGAPVTTRTNANEYSKYRYWSEWLTDTSGASAGGAVGQTIDIDQNDSLNLIVVPKATRILPGRVSWGALGASVTLIVGLYPYDKDKTDYIGTVIDADLLLASEDVSSAGTSTMATLDVAPEVMGYVTTADAVIVAKIEGGSPATAKQLNFLFNFMPVA